MPCIIDNASGIISVIKAKIGSLDLFWRILLKFRRKEGIINEKMLVKAVALSLVLGGVGFVANNAQAFSPIEEIQLKSKVDANHERSMNNQTAI